MLVRGINATTIAKAWGYIIHLGTASRAERVDLSRVSGSLSDRSENKVKSPVEMTLDELRDEYQKLERESVRLHKAISDALQSSEECTDKKRHIWDRIKAREDAETK